VKIKNLVIECEQIVCTSTVKRGEDPAHLKMTLEDVRVDSLMVELVKELDVETVLGYFPDHLIKKYAEGIK
jgi:hypothetical protein